MNADSAQAEILRSKVIPVAVIDSPQDAAPLARALADGGLPLIEVTLRTPAALDCVRAIRRECPDVLVAAGTVLSAAQAAAAIEAGAHIGVSPGVNAVVVRAARERSWFFMPGVVTPTDIEAALELGCRLLKFFPAGDSGGVKTLKTLGGVYEHTGVKFIPLGGVSISNLAEYLTLPVVAAVGGTWLCDRRLVREKKWGEITALASAAAAEAAAVKPAAS